MQLLLDNQKVWKLAKELHAAGHSDKKISEILYKEHSLVSNRKTPHSPASIHRIRKGKKPKARKHIYRENAQHTRPSPDKDMPQKYPNKEAHMLHLVHQILAMKLQDSVTVNIIGRLLHLES